MRGGGAQFSIPCPVVRHKTGKIYNQHMIFIIHIDRYLVHMYNDYLGWVMALLSF